MSGDHHLIDIKYLPASLIAFRRELCAPQNIDIFNEAIKCPDFSQSIATVARMLNIVLDGNYDVESLLAMLTDELINRHKKGGGINPRLVPCMIVERESTINLEVAPVGSAFREGYVLQAPSATIDLQAAVSESTHHSQQEHSQTSLHPETPAENE